MNGPVTDNDLNQIFTAIVLLRLVSPLDLSDPRIADACGATAARIAHGAVKELNRIKEESFK